MKRRDFGFRNEFLEDRRKERSFRKFKRIGILLVILVVLLGGCSFSGEGISSISELLLEGKLPNIMINEFGKFNESIKGRSYSIRTFTDGGDVIDSIKGSSVYIESVDKFNQKNSSGETIEKSSVIELAVGGNSIIHVGSSLVAYEDGLVDVFDEYAKSHSIVNEDSSRPIINSIVNDLKNMGKGKKKVVLIRSKAGEPIATFAGDSVSYFATNIDKTTSILVDGKSVFIYRCDYTIYDADLLN